MAASSVKKKKVFFKCHLKVVTVSQVAVLAAQVAQLVLVEGPFAGFGARRRVEVVRVEVSSRSAARRIFGVEFCRNRKFVNVETSGAFAESGKKDVDFDGMKRGSLSAIIENIFQ